MRAKEVAHRNAKPRNILLDARNYPCISDLRLAKFRNTPGLTDKMGTPVHMAPEIIAADSEEATSLSFQLDVYSYAVRLWEVVVGTKRSMAPQFRNLQIFWNATRNADNAYRPRRTKFSRMCTETCCGACGNRSWMCGRCFGKSSSSRSRGSFSCRDKRRKSFSGMSKS
jgi:serine/threonine protein kinase